jgi:hypothetical protein
LFFVEKDRIVFVFPLNAEDVFDVLQISLFLGIDALSELSKSMFKNYLKEDMVDAQAIALLPEEGKSIVVF